MQRIRVQEADFDAGRELCELALLADNAGATASVGAVASFIGYVRGSEPDPSKVGAGGTAVTAMTLEHYPGMTEKALQDIVASAAVRWVLDGVTVIHRVGRLLPGDQIVLVAVASRHRGAAFAACEYIMDFLKTQAPFWKCEETAAGSRWVDARETDNQAAARWRVPESGG